MAFSRRKQFLFAGDYFLRCLFKDTETGKRESGEEGVGEKRDCIPLILVIKNIVLSLSGHGIAVVLKRHTFPSQSQARGGGLREGGWEIHFQTVQRKKKCIGK